MTVSLMPPSGEDAIDFQKQIEDIEQRGRWQDAALSFGACALATAGTVTFIQEQKMEFEEGLPDPRVKVPVEIAADVISGVSGVVGLAFCAAS